MGRGDRVALLAHNGVEFFDVQFSCGRTGSIAVLLNWRLTVSVKPTERLLKSGNATGVAVTVCVGRP